LVNIKPYAARVTNHARTTIENSLYSGTDFGDLAWLLSQPQDMSEDASSLHVIDEDQATVALLYEFDASTPSAAVRLTRTSSEAVVRGHPNRNRLIFLLGYPSAQLLNMLGTMYDVDPEFYRRHLSNNSHPKAATTASKSPAFTLPSFERSIVHLTITTMGHKDERSVESLEELREVKSDNLDEYLTGLQLSNGWRPGDSVVRTFNLHDRMTFSIEQQVTIYIRKDPQHTDQWIRGCTASSQT
jgi:hypothetical protein